jgi:hypothetical protein
MLDTEQFDFEWREGEKECFWHNEETRMFYPCIEFVKHRIAKANELGHGVMVWEGGQGPHYLYNLF